MRAPRLVLGILAAATGLSATACGGGDDDAAIDARPRPDGSGPIDAAPPDASGSVLPEDLPVPLPSGPVTASTMTFNVGLIPTVIGRTQRLPAIIEAIEASGVDIVCFQEVFTSYDQSTDPVTYIDPAMVAAELADVYPYAAWDLRGTSSLSNGVMIVSKVPLYRQRFVRFTMNDGNTVDRAVIAATAVDEGERWHLNVMCAHLQAGLDPSNTTARRDQLREIDELAEAEGYNDAPSVLLADFNAGPDPDPLDEECTEGVPSCPATCSAVDTLTIDMVEDTYGWTDWSDDLAFTPCTYCKADADALAYPVALFPCEGSQRIDHCFTRNLGTAAVTSMTREMDEDPNYDPPIPLRNDPETGEPIGNAATLSDHFAVRCDIAVP